MACIALAAPLHGCASTRSTSDGGQAEASGAVHRAHSAFVEAINSNDADAIMAAMTEDVVFMAPNQPRLIGKAAVRPWVEGYIEAYRTRWTKTTLEMVESGDWAFEQYAYESVDTPRAGGRPIRDTGKGIMVYRRSADGRWLVARDAWNSDLSAAE